MMCVLIIDEYFEPSFRDEISEGMVYASLHRGQSVVLSKEHY
jgi:hypothetical protein